MSFRFSQVAHWPMLLVALVPIACGRVSSQPALKSTSETESELTWQQQVLLVADGKTNRIAIQRMIISDEELESLPELSGLRELSIDLGKISDRGVAALVKQPSLERLRLRDSPISDTGLSSLSECRALQQINLPQSTCTIEGIQHLGQLPDLMHLRLGSTLLSGEMAGLAISALKNLRTLHLIDIAIDDAGLLQLSTLPKLSSLYLDGAKVSDHAWDHFFEDHPQIHVHIDQHHSDRDPQRHD